MANQKLRLQTQDALKLQKRTPTERRRCSTSALPAAWLKRDRVPTFLVGQFQDEQTGGHFAEALAYLKHNPNVWISLQNGVHADSLGPTTITRWAEFLKIYVANEVPRIPPAVIDLSGALYSYLADAPAAPVRAVALRRDDDVAAAKADLQARPARARC